MNRRYAKHIGSWFMMVNVMCAGAMPLSSPVGGPLPAWPNAAGDCHGASSSGDGRWVVFASAADNLVTNDNNGTMDVFVRDRALGRTILVSIDADGLTSGNGSSHDAALSSDGGMVVFQSAASNLIAGDTNNAADVFVRDLTTGVTKLVSHDPNSGAGNGESTLLGLTPDGRYVLFASFATNLVTPDNNVGVDLFLSDLEHGTNAMVTRNYLNNGSHSAKGAVWTTRQALSDDGRFVAFESGAPDLVRGDLSGRADVFVRDLQAGTNLPVTLNLARTGMANNNSGNLCMDATGRYCAFESMASDLTANDTTSTTDVFRWDRVTATCTLVSVNTNGTGSGVLDRAVWPVISGDGNSVAFFSYADNLIGGDTNRLWPDLMLRNISQGQTTRIEEAKTSGYFTVPVLSSNADFILFQDNESNLVLLNTQDRSRTTIAIDTTTDEASMTEDASFITFVAPTNGWRNIFVYERLSGVTELVSRADSGLARATSLGGGRLTSKALSAHGEFAVFESSANDFNPGDSNGNRAAWLCDLSFPSNSPVRLGSLIPEISRGPSRWPVVSESGRWIAYEAIPDAMPISGLSNRFNLYAFDLIAQTNLLVGGVGSPAAPSLAVLSRDGHALAFQSSQTGAGGYTTTVMQVYYRKLSEPTNRLVSLNVAGTTPGNLASQAPAISPSGRYVVYLSSATSLTTNAVSGYNVFLWDAQTGLNRLVNSVGMISSQSPPSGLAFWAEGSLFSFQSSRTNYLFDTESQALLATLPDLTSLALNGDGSLVVGERWGSYSPFDQNLLPDVYVLDRFTGSNLLVSVNLDGVAAGGRRPAISHDGRYVLFTGRLPLRSNDTNQAGDVFLRDMLLNRTIVLSQNSSGNGTGNKLSANAVWSSDGSTILMESYASDLVDGDFNANRDLFLVRLHHGDSDGDGLVDDWELAYFNTLERNGDGDYDNDTQSDRAEHLSGTDPSNSLSVFQVITCQRPGANTTRIIWSAVPGKKYRVETRRSASDPEWTALPGDVIATEDTASKDDTGASAGGAQSFYRVVLIP